MSKRTKLKLRNLRLFLIKCVFNGRYIVRNLIAATILMAIVAAVMSVAMITGDRDEDVSEGKMAEYKPVIYVSDTSNLDMSSISVLMAGFEADNETMVQANESEMVAEIPGEFDTKFVTITDDVNVREDATTDSRVVGTLNYGNVGNIISSDGEWIYFTSGEVTGYVKAEFVVTGSAAEAYVTPGTEYTTATPVIVEENDSNFEENDDNYQSGNSTYEEPVYETPSENVTTESTTEEDSTSSDNQITVGTTYRSPITLTEDEINLMACIVTLESGSESYEGQLAVANVIINRLQTGIWGNTVTDVIYAPGQFSTAYSSSLDYYLENGAYSTSIQAVKDALAGTNNIGSFTSFRPTYLANPDSYDTYTIIGNHVFF